MDVRATCVAKLKGLDEDVLEYVIGMLEGDESDDDKSEALSSFLISCEHCATEEQATATCSELMAALKPPSVDVSDAAEEASAAPRAHAAEGGRSHRRARSHGAPSPELKPTNLQEFVDFVNTDQVDRTGQLGSITSPTLVLTSGSMPQRFASDIPGAVERIHPDGGHLLPEEQPDWVADAVAEFFHRPR